jgi:hypothetical protein
VGQWPPGKLLRRYQVFNLIIHSPMKASEVKTSYDGSIPHVRIYTIVEILPHTVADLEISSSLANMPTMPFLGQIALEHHVILSVALQSSVSGCLG